MIIFIHSSKKPEEVKVKLDKKIIGYVRKKNNMWRYYPKGSFSLIAGDPFKSLLACKGSVAGDEPWETIKK